MLLSRSLSTNEIVPSSVFIVSPPPVFFLLTMSLLSTIICSLLELKKRSLTCALTSDVPAIWAPAAAVSSASSRGWERDERRDRERMHRLWCWEGGRPS